MIIKSAIIFAIVGVISGRNYYQDRIPNGHFVPNPCLTSQYWNTVGHLNPAHHTHLKNIFGHVKEYTPSYKALIHRLDLTIALEALFDFIRFSKFVADCGFSKNALVSSINEETLYVEIASGASTLEFRANGHVWTAAFCQMDSDKDGKSNGEELGDPNCTWQPGQTPDGSAIGHPGICEPVGDARCSYQNFACDCLEHCSGVDGYP